MSKTDPWDELMAVARTYAVNSEEDELYCENCGAEWPHFESEQHEPDCPIRPNRKNPYAGLVEAAENLVKRSRKLADLGEDASPSYREVLMQEMSVAIAFTDTALAKVRGDG